MRLPKHSTQLYADRIVAIDIRAESMGAKSILNVTVNTVDGNPTLTKETFPLN